MICLSKYMNNIYMRIYHIFAKISNWVSPFFRRGQSCAVCKVLWRRSCQEDCCLWKYLLTCHFHKDLKLLKKPISKVASTESLPTGPVVQVSVVYLDRGLGTSRRSRPAGLPRPPGPPGKLPPWPGLLHSAMRPPQPSVMLSDRIINTL